ncbi:MAG: hypothetical protein HUU16_10910 [Candidatus Omnitrophica bacterium]|nr:hypothetical protein [bacterium]NUN96670.1 hypothetical protein [Candidatus Omnitrophota bacterium]
MPPSSQFAFVLPDPDGESAFDYRPPRVRTNPLKMVEPPPLMLPKKKACPFPPLEEGISPFPDCAEFAHAGGCKVVVHQHYGGSRGDILRCKTCSRTFSSRRCGVFFKSRLPEEVVETLQESFRRGESIRQTAKRLGLNRGTVRRYFSLMDDQTGEV